MQDETTARDSHSKCPPHASILLLSPAHSFVKDPAVIKPWERARRKLLPSSPLAGRSAQMKASPRLLHLRAQLYLRAATPPLRGGCCTCTLHLHAATSAP